MSDFPELARLPYTIRQLIVKGPTGPIDRIQPVSTSRHGLALHVYGTRQAVFLRATPMRSPELLLYKRERSASLSLPLDAPAPRLLWTTAVDGWLVLAYELINDNADHAFLSPDPESLDVPLVLDAVQRLGKVLTPGTDERARPVFDLVTSMWAMANHMLNKAPTVLRGRDLFEDALHGFDLEALQGDTLLHGNLSPRHLRIKDGQVYAVDWSQACRGAAGVDPALLAPHFVEAGYSPEHTEALMASIPAWNELPAAQAAGLTALWTLARLYAVEHGHQVRHPEQTRLSDAGRAWLAHLLARL
ncbi:hypothetical protein FH608_023810 [Nonomuraea phyllanthi]|uniref:Aminoglycoside phosphotransferase domain-containing protein n=1 Tax=Nonomuraea phyllanthi TaxID=2219224 RepID=A0A5C4W900_9ACTN|nr:hypothetical protein [Nonomuraea phyllanthi]KAB8192536.1 hypothetical protein FH608_023810 [Nonomuraea phyllanthi]